MLSSSFATFQPSPYKSFTDYTDIQEMKGSDSACGHARFTAHEKNPSNKPNTVYGDTWFLLMREGLYRAQVEKAMSEIYQYFMGVSTEIEIVKKGEDYYAASHGIRQPVEWNTFTLSAKIQEDGAVVCQGSEGKQKAIRGLAEMSVLAKFFLDDDIHSGQFVLQEREDCFQVIKIDNEKALDIEAKEEDEEEENSDDEEDTIKISNYDEFFANFTAVDITKATSYEKEKHAMSVKLASTDFTVIESILRKNITSNRLESMKWLLQRMMQGADEEGKNDLSVQLKKIEAANAENYNIDAIVETLNISHELLRSEFKNKYSM